MSDEELVKACGALYAELLRRANAGKCNLVHFPVKDCPFCAMGGAAYGLLRVVKALEASK